MKEITRFEIMVSETAWEIGTKVSSGNNIEVAIAEAKKIGASMASPVYTVRIKYHSDRSFKSAIKACKYLVSKNAINAFSK